VGGVVGGASGVESGPGAIATAAGGAALGGAAGEGARQAITRYTHPEDRKMGMLESGAHIVGQGALQGVNELGGRVAGKVVGKALAPVAEAAATKYPAIAKILGTARELLLLL